MDRSLGVTTTSGSAALALLLVLVFCGGKLRGRGGVGHWNRSGESVPVEEAEAPSPAWGSSPCSPGPGGSSNSATSCR